VTTARRRVRAHAAEPICSPLAPARALPPTEYAALIHAARRRRGASTGRDLFLLQFLARTGLRVSEALSVRVRDLFLSYRPAFVRVLTLKQRGRPRLHDVYLEPATVALVRGWIRPLAPRDLLFGGITRRNASRVFRLYARFAGLPPGRTLHSLRHYRASYLYTKTRDPEFVRSQLRHRSISTTQGYLSIPEDQVAKYLELL